MLTGGALVPKLEKPAPARNPLRNIPTSLGFCFLSCQFCQLIIRSIGPSQLRVLGLVDHPHRTLAELLEDLVVGYGLAYHFTLQQVSNVVGKTKGAVPGSGPIIAQCQTAVQDQLLEHPTDAEVPVFCRRPMAN